jgi:hypothetical protein
MLIGGKSSNEGNVLIFNSTTGIPSPICDIHWGIEEVLYQCLFREYYSNINNAKLGRFSRVAPFVRFL